MTSMRRNNVASTSFRRHVPTRFLINQCQIITILILKSDIIENSRIELREIVLPVPSNQIKLHLLLFYPSTWYICDFFPFHIEIEGKGGWIIAGGGQWVCWPPLPNYCWGGLAPPGPPPPPPPPPLPTPMYCLSRYPIFFYQSLLIFAAQTQLSYNHIHKWVNHHIHTGKWLNQPDID